MLHVQEYKEQKNLNIYMLFTITFIRIEISRRKCERAKVTEYAIYAFYNLNMFKNKMQD